MNTTFSPVNSLEDPHRNNLRKARAKGSLTLLTQGATLLGTLLLGFAFTEAKAPVVLNLGVYVLGMIAIAVLAVHASVKVVAVWNDGRRNQQPPGPAWPGVGPVIARLASAIVIGAAVHISYFANGQVSIQTIIESLNYSVQTATTVGYGDWIPAGTHAGDPKLVAVRAFSIFLMLGGATFFTVTVGVLTTWYQAL
jgi:Ion channel